MQSSSTHARRSTHRSVGRYCLIAALTVGVIGCKSGAAGNPFKATPTRVPPPTTRSFQSGSGYAPAGNTTVPGGAVGTGLPATGANWSSTPGAVNAANAAGVYTSWLERTGSGYISRSAPTGGSPPAAAPPVPNTNTRSSWSPDSQFPSAVAGPSYPVQPAGYQQPWSSPPTAPPNYATPRYDDSPVSTPPPASTYPPLPPANDTSGLIWRAPRP